MKIKAILDPHFRPMALETRNFNADVAKTEAQKIAISIVRNEGYTETLTVDVFADGVNDITRYLRKRNTGTRDEMAVDFTGTFTGIKTYEGKTAVPYKSVFTSEDGLMYQEGFREVYHAFKAEAIKKRAGLDYPDDHISFLCQFMAIMSRRTLEALQAGDYDKAAHDVKASTDFLDNNILSWYDQLMERSLLLIKTRFYKGVMKLARGFFTLDRETLADLSDEVAELAEAAKKAEGTPAE